ncbi:unnamed protein product [Trichogramma brassicae]|uniref:Uncharacterized protein n=1 Tax=Trichogramma brassicae TaxID=86971 RepID=A0A6H5HZJ1_9HYME|nr:unnamed protein product [Trichogramma brassicae]CAB0030286.1 unnamed protein product [Trichogramma brassicae]CAB0030288.1 unnamed protein product [Trichogramma brassicae]
MKVLVKFQKDSSIFKGLIWQPYRNNQVWSGQGQSQYRWQYKNKPQFYNRVNQAKKNTQHQAGRRKPMMQKN